MYDAFTDKDRTGITPERPGPLAVSHRMGMIGQALRTLTAAVLAMRNAAFSID
jgi:hypothetical protein